jgi:zinc protease
LADINQLLDLIIDALKTQGVTEEEIDQAKAKVIGNSIFNSRDINSQAYLLGYYQVIAGNYNFSSDYLEAIAKVTRADVQRVTQKYLSPANQTVGYLEPTEVDPKTSASISKGILQIPPDFPLQESVQAEEVAQYLPPISPVDAGYPPKLPQRFTLANGLTVLMLPDSSVSAISLQGYLRAGGEFDPSDRIGLANLTAFNLVNGSNRRPIAPIQALENRGGVALDFQADTDGVRIFGVCLSNNLSFLLDNLADVLQNASLPADVLELLRQQYLSGLKVWADNPAYVSAQAIAEAIYPTHHPLRQLPTPATIKAISQEDTVAFYRQYYRPDSTVLVFVGDFDPVQLRSQIETILGHWSAKGKPPVVDWPSVLLPSKKIRLNKVLPGMTEAVITIGTPIPDWTNWPDSSYLATLVLNEILGNSALSSRLGNEVRYRQGLAYALQSSLQEGLHTGLFLIGIETAPENTERAIASTFAVFKQLREQGVTEFEVEIAKRSLISNYQLTQSNPDSLASQILTHQLFGDNPDEIRQWPRKVQEISLTQVNQMAQLLLDPERMVVVTVEPD